MLVIPEQGEVFPAKFARPQHMPQLKELSLDVKKKANSVEERDIMKSIEFYPNKISLHLYLKVDFGNEEALPVLNRANKYWDLKVVTLRLKYWMSLVPSPLIEPILSLTSLKKLTIERADVGDISGFIPSRYHDVSAFSKDLHKLSNLDYLEPEVKEKEFVWHLPPSLRRLFLNIRLFRVAPTNLSMFDTIRHVALDLTTTDEILDFQHEVPFTRLESVYFIGVVNNSIPLIERVVKNNPSLTSIGLCNLQSHDVPSPHIFHPFISHLQHIEFHGFKLLVEDVVPLAWPNLHNLTGFTFLPQSANLSSLTRELSSTGNLPNLKTMKGYFRAKDVRSIFTDAELDENIKQYALIVEPFFRRLTMEPSNMVIQVSELRDRFT